MIIHLLQLIDVPFVCNINECIDGGSTGGNELEGDGGM